MHELPSSSTESVRLWRRPSQRFDATFTGLSLRKAPLSEHMIESWQVDVQTSETYYRNPTSHTNISTIEKASPLFVAANRGHITIVAMPSVAVAHLSTVVVHKVGQMVHHLFRPTSRMVPICEIPFDYHVKGFGNIAT